MGLTLSLPQPQLVEYVTRLLDAHTPDGGRHDVSRAVGYALERAEHCFAQVALGGYTTEPGEARFSHLHGDQFAQFLYWLGHLAWKELEDEELAQKATLLNRSRSALNVMYDTVLPEIFLIPHTIGTAIGKNDFSDYTVFCHNVTVSHDYVTRLQVGPGVIFFPGAFVVGAGTIGAGAVITANSTVAYCDVPAHTMVRGMSPELEMWPRTRDLLARYFHPGPALEAALR